MFCSFNTIFSVLCFTVPQGTCAMWCVLFNNNTNGHVCITNSTHTYNSRLKAQCTDFVASQGIMQKEKTGIMFPERSFLVEFNVIFLSGGNDHLVIYYSTGGT